MKLHLNIDIETIGARPDSVVLQVAGVKFNPYAPVGEGIVDDFSFNLLISDQSDRYRDPSTEKWWANQHPDVKASAWDQSNGLLVNEFLEFFTIWSKGVAGYWAQGPSFDYAILENLYRSNGKTEPWKFWQIRDSRTTKELTPRCVC
jgi:hypothetical protein